VAVVFDWPVAETWSDDAGMTPGDAARPCGRAHTEPARRSSAGCRRVWEHSGATITALAIDGVPVHGLGEPGGGRRASVSDLPVVEHALVLGPARRPPIYGWRILLGVVALALVSVGGGIAYVIETGQSGGDDQVSGWIRVIAVAGLTAVIIAVRWVMTNVARRRLFTDAQPVRLVEAHLSFGRVMIRPPRGGRHTLVIPADVFPKDVVGPASLYGEPVHGGWCAVEVDGELVVPTGPSEVRPREL
jgi:hypothetical protein